MHPDMIFFNIWGHQLSHRSLISSPTPAKWVGLRIVTFRGLQSPIFRHLITDIFAHFSLSYSSIMFSSPTNKKILHRRTLVRTPAIHTRLKLIPDCSELFVLHLCHLDSVAHVFALLFGICCICLFVSWAAWVVWDFFSFFNTVWGIWNSARGNSNGAW